MNRARTDPRLALALVTLLVAAGLTGCVAGERTLSLRDNIHHDDFEYAALRLDKLDRIGDTPATGVYYVVTFQVDNRAKRVNHEWDNTLAFIVDERGRQYENDTAAQKRLEALHPFGYRDRYVTSPGVVATTRFVFDLPQEVTEPYLKVRGGSLMGDVLDGQQFLHTRIKLF